MKGSVRLKGKTWSYRIDLGKADGKRKQVEKSGYKTEREALQAMNDVIHHYNHTGEYIENQKFTFQENYEQFMVEEAPATRAYATIKKYESLYRAQLKDEFGPSYLFQISANRIQKFLYDKSLEYSQEYSKSIGRCRPTTGSQTLKGIPLLNGRRASAYGRPGFKLMIAGGEGIPVVLLALEIGIAEGFRILEEHPERLGQLVVLLDQSLIIDLFQKGCAGLVFGGGGDEVRPGFNVEPLLVGQHLVPDIAAATEGLFKKLRLGLGGVEPDFEGGVLSCFASLGSMALLKCT